MLRYLLALALTSGFTAASACGYCVEDSPGDLVAARPRPKS